MIYVREFEFYEAADHKAVIAAPFDLGEGTFGADMNDAVESAADYLFEYITDRLVDGLDIPEPTFGNEPDNGGKVIAIAVDCDLSRVRSVSASEAADILGVSRPRVTQMCEAGLLQSWKEGSRRLITLDSVEARLAEQPKPGRPRKTTPKTKQTSAVAQASTA